MLGFIDWLRFGGSLGTECMTLYNEPCMTRPIIINLNPVELKYYQFVISLDTCSGSRNFIDDLSTKICLRNKTKDINGKLFDMITNKNDEKIQSYDQKCRYNSIICN